MYSNLVKRGYTNLQQEEKRVINSNELVAKRLEEYVFRRQSMDTDGFVSGIMAASLEVSPEASVDETADGNVIKAEPKETVEEMLSRARQEAEDILAQAKREAELLTTDARAEAEKLRQQIIEEARQQGYREGMEKASKEAVKAEQELKTFRQQLAEEYDGLVEELEPQLIDTITGIYEHIFQVELSSYRNILLYLLSSAMSRIESSRSYIIHVSKEDYPYVSMQKKQLMAGIASAGSTVEIIEDITLVQNEAFIETDGGLFDCGLGTQLAELRQKLKLLSYEK